MTPAEVAVSLLEQTAAIIESYSFTVAERQALVDAHAALDAVMAVEKGEAPTWAPPPVEEPDPGPPADFVPEPVTKPVEKPEELQP